MTLRERALACAAIAAILSASVAALGKAQNPDDIDLDEAFLSRPAARGEEAERDELRAFRLVGIDRFARARELCAEILRRDPRSFVAEFVLGVVEHSAEGSFPRAVYHFTRARTFYEARFGNGGETIDRPWRWHARILAGLAMALGDLERPAERLTVIARYNELYEPDMIAERAWALMKLGRFEDARRAAREGIETGRSWQRQIGLNALCAIEFEAGRDGASYEWCRRAVEDARASGGMPSVADLTNFAEASRSVFKLAEAEDTLREATEGDPSGYGNPWTELADLYMREARFADALEALQKAVEYRNERPPPIRDSDRNEHRRSLATFFLGLGRSHDAVRLSSSAVLAPDRRAHTSRDPLQDLALTSLVDRRARLVESEARLEGAAAKSFGARLWARCEWLFLRAGAWESERRVASLLSDERRLEGIFRIGTASSAVAPPWLVGDLVDVLGPAVVRRAVARSAARDQRELAAGYYAAFLADAAHRDGDDATLTTHALTALRVLPREERLLRARVNALLADRAAKSGRWREAGARYQEALAIDPGVFRRLGLSIPLRVHNEVGELGDRIATALFRADAFTEEDDSPLTLRVVDGGRQVCLGLPDSSERCALPTAPPRASQDAQVAAAVRESFARLLTPPVQLSDVGANALDQATPSRARGANP